MIIYKTTNLVNGKIYIGKDLKNNSHYLGSGKILKRAFAKYGKENFSKEILEECQSIDILNEREKYWIAFFDSTNMMVGYNIMEGGHGGNNHNYRRGSDHPYFGKERPKNVGQAVAKANRERKKVFGDQNKSYKNIDDTIKSLILSLSVTMGREKIHQTLCSMEITCFSPRTLSRRLTQWKEAIL